MRSDVARRYRKSVSRSSRFIRKNLLVLHKKSRSETLHDFRVAIKRLRAYASILPDAIDLSMLDRLWVRSGRLRNVQVQKRFLSEVMSESSCGNPAILGFVKKREQKARKKLKKEIKRLDPANLQATLHEIKTRTRETADDAITNTISKKITDGIPEIERLTHSAMCTPEIHLFRMKVKELNYLMDLLPNHASAEVRNMNLDLAGELLGDWHDCEIGLRLIRRFYQKFPSESASPELQAALAEKKQTFYSSAMNSLGITERGMKEFYSWYPGKTRAGVFRQK